MATRFRGALAACVLAAGLALPAGAALAEAQPNYQANSQANSHAAKPEAKSETKPEASSRTSPQAKPAAQHQALPPDSTTRHKLALPDGRTLDFTATAGSIRLTRQDSGAPVADIAYIAFRLEGVDSVTRPVTFALNGGPGYASAWLNLGAMGPWRLPMDASAAFPAASPRTLPNAETWLPFTDLVFIDPAGAGYSRVRGGEEARKMLWSVNGDIDSLATTMRRWIEKNGRNASPVFIAGESYGGFRAPKIAHRLQTDQGIGVDGLVLVSPVLDFGRFNSRMGLFDHVARLPSYVAARRANEGPVTRADLADVEAYARGAYLNDLVAGLKDREAVARVSKRVAELTGLPLEVTRRHAGRVPMMVFLNEFRRADNRVVSMYDANVEGLDPSPYSGRPEAEDQMRLGLHAPIIRAMVSLYQNELQYRVPDGRWFFHSEQAHRQWDWGQRARQEAVSDLASSMALDPSMRVLVAHGLTDLVTPYFETQMVLDQMAPIGDPKRLRFEVYPGGHMFYSLETSRRMFRDHARAMIEARG